MEKIIHLTEDEYNQLEKEKYSFELSIWNDYGRGREKMILIHFTSDDSSDITKSVVRHIDAWNNRQEYVDRIYNRNLIQRILNKRIEILDRDT